MLLFVYSDFMFADSLNSVKFATLDLLSKVDLSIGSLPNHPMNLKFIDSTASRCRPSLSTPITMGIYHVSQLLSRFDLFLRAKCNILRLSE